VRSHEENFDLLKHETWKELFFPNVINSFSFWIEELQVINKYEERERDILAFISDPYY
jgi:hypothetical protein